ncbi:hypothetical protein AB0I81_13010 [Nonomuraea sp. NPDC050404]|uniref:hypothetical protein n=1 Tax=Nonomuraea sp. NPDC050404 TaxID=3155783 RepID=UPI0033E93E2A
MTALGLAIATAAVTFGAGAPTPAPTDPPPERAYVCEWGGRGPYQWRPGYTILAGGCTGPENGGAATISWTSGGLTQTYRCLRVVWIAEDGVLGGDC